jgi:hypothetical protein
MDFTAFGVAIVAITTLLNSITIAIVIGRINKLEKRIDAIEYREWNSSRE